MRYDEISLKVREIVANLFERDAATLSDDTLLMQDLPCGRMFQDYRIGTGSDNCHCSFYFHIDSTFFL